MKSASEILKRAKKEQSIVEGVLLLIAFRKDFQFDRKDQGYLGFLNTGVPLLSDEDGETFKFIVKNQDIFSPIMEELGLRTESGLDEEETVFIVTTENFPEG
jgi:hypothetical protein